MNARPLLLRRLRLVLDGLLVCLIVVLAIAYHQPARAGDAYQASAAVPSAVDSAALMDIQSATSRVASTNPFLEQPLLDNNTLAEIIAAENAALTLPQYLVDLPIISR